MTNKSITSVDGEIVVDVPALQRELVACGWRISHCCGRRRIAAVRAALQRTAAGRRLIEDLAANRPTSGPSGKSTLARVTVTGWDETELARVREIAGTHGDVSAWIRAACAEKLAREKN